MEKKLFGVSLLTALLAIADLLLVRAWVQENISSLIVILGHVAAVVVLGGLKLASKREDRERTLGTALFAILLGPLGGVMLLLVELGKSMTLLSISPTSTSAAAPSRAEVIHAQIVQGRRRHSDSSLPEDFIEVFSTGTLRRKQSAIAAISQSYKPEMLPALKIALASELPMIRVQAAAVFAKLRGTFDARAKALRALASSGPLSPEHAAEAEIVAASGFLDADTAAELRALARVKPRHAGPYQTDPLPRTRLRARRFPVRPPRLKRHSCGGVA